MIVGLPGTGIGGVFYILLSMHMPLFQLRRALKGGHKPRHFKIVVSALFLSAAIILSLYAEVRFLVWFSGLVVTSGDTVSGPAAFGGYSAASVAPVLAAMPFLVLTVIIVCIHFARLVLSRSSRRKAGIIGRLNIIQHVVLSSHPAGSDIWLQREGMEV
jgi:hypothetical protein